MADAFLHTSSIWFYHISCPHQLRHKYFHLHRFRSRHSRTVQKDDSCRAKPFSWPSPCTCFPNPCFGRYTLWHEPHHQSHHHINSIFVSQVKIFNNWRIMEVQRSLCWIAWKCGGLFLSWLHPLYVGNRMLHMTVYTVIYRLTHWGKTPGRGFCLLNPIRGNNFPFAWWVSKFKCKLIEVGCSADHLSGLVIIPVNLTGLYGFG